MPDLPLASQERELHGKDLSIALSSLTRPVFPRQLLLKSPMDQPSLKPGLLCLPFPAVFPKCQ